MPGIMAELRPKPLLSIDYGLDYRSDVDQQKHFGSIVYTAIIATVVRHVLRVFKTSRCMVILKGFRKETDSLGIQSRETKPSQKSNAFKDLPLRRGTPRSTSARRFDHRTGFTGSGAPINHRFFLEPYPCGRESPQGFSPASETGGNTSQSMLIRSVLASLI